MKMKRFFSSFLHKRKQFLFTMLFSGMAFIIFSLTFQKRLFVFSLIAIGLVILPMIGMTITLEFLFGLCGLLKNKRCFYKNQKTAQVIIVEENWKGEIVASLVPVDFEIEPVRAVLYLFELTTEKNTELELIRDDLKRL